MKKHIFTLLVILLGVMELQANTFYMYCGKVFSPEEEVSVSFNNQYYYYRNKHSENEDLDLRLYQIPDKIQVNIDKLITSGYYLKVPTDLLSKCTEVKKWDQQVKNNQYSATLNLGKLKKGMY